MSPGLHLVSPSLLMPVADQIETAGASLARLANSAGLPLEALESGEPFVPRYAAQRFGVIATRYAGDPLLFYKSASRGIEPLVTEASRPITGRVLPAFEILDRVFSLAARVTPTVRFHATVEGTRLWLRRSNVEPRSRENWQFEQYSVGAMETLAVSVLGERASPVEIWLRSSARTNEFPRSWEGRRVAVHQQFTAIAVCATALVQRSRAIVPAPSAGLDIGTESASELGQAVLKYASDPGMNIDLVAEAFGLNRRTFQRRLKRLGYTYSSLVEEARFQIALDMFEQADARVTDVAIEAGYSCLENFTRAFRRRFGMPPSRYRLLQR